MRLSSLSGERHAVDPEIAGIAVDSRLVKPGYLFAAMPGVKLDGAKFIDAAIRNGAGALLVAPGVDTPLPAIVDDNPRRRLALVAARFRPRQPATIAAVTGTNGKTSTVRFAASLWSMLGERAGSLGTIGAVAPGYERTLAHTTPEPIALHEILDEMAEAGVTHLAMEASSHALAQHRADAVRLSVAAFTNITQDHLDFHKNFDDYFAAKRRLFTDLLPTVGAAVVNADGAGADEAIAAARQRSLRVLTTGAKGADLVLRSLRPTATGLSLVVTAGGREWAIELPLIGAYQAENALLAAGVVAASGRDFDEIIPLLERLPPVPGRMERAAGVGGGAIFVDYAHTPDAVATALRSIRPHAAGRVIALIGAGGDRDRGKRPLMGRAAAENADLVIVTDDNPRGEDPAAIRRAILDGCRDAIEIGDRAEAIERGAALLGPGDILLIAGKGHETGQIVGDQVHPFSDVEAARRAAEQLKERR